VARTPRRLRRETGDDDALHLAVVDQYEDGVTLAQDQARATGLAIEDIYRARRNIARRAKAMRARGDPEGGESHAARARAAGPSPANEDGPQDDEVGT
jgi:hypothetical protein